MNFQESRKHQAVKVAVPVGTGNPLVGEDISRVSKAPSLLLSFSRLMRNVLAGACREGW